MNLTRNVVACMLGFVVLRMASEVLANIPGGGTGTIGNVSFSNPSPIRSTMTADSAQRFYRLQLQ